MKRTTHLRSLFFAFGLAALPILALAQEPLSWSSCVEEAALQNTEIAAAQESVRRAQHQLRGSRSGYYPQLSGDAGYTRANSATSLQSLGSGSGLREEFSLGLSARQNFFTGFRDRAGVQKAKTDVDAAEARLQTVKARVGFDLESAFARLLFAQQQLVLAESIAGRRRENMQLVEARYEGGREHMGSVLRSRAALRQAEYEFSQAKRALRLAQRQLAKVLGRDGTEDLSVAGELAASSPEGPPDFQALVRQTPDYRQSIAQSVSARASLGIARAALYPEVNAQGSLSRRGTDWPPDNDRWSAGVGLSLPIFSGGRRRADVASARTDVRRTRLDLKSFESQTALALENAFFSYQDAAEKTRVQEEYLKAAELRSEISRSQYTSGLLSFEDWDLIENDLISNQKSVLASRRDAVIAKAAWEQTQGKGPIP
ncbi:MAG: TolC family protein [Elusimicrobia bacterium]|nr:TolC family protein [Elusimicrobiota bacterium]